MTTCISHIYNEEYLLPFWLEHHKNIFDNIIIIDYKSTDNSIEICKKICPNIKIITTRNANFGAIEIDQEIMDIENQIDGIKMVLNVTEFLFCEKPIKEIFNEYNEKISLSINCFSCYSKKKYNVYNTYELFSNLLNDDIKFHTDRFTRQIHNYKNGNYTLGRHDTHNKTFLTNKLHIIWFGFYPMNDLLIKRKLQIKDNIPERDKNNGWGFQHLFSIDKILSIMNDKANTGIELKFINLSLFNLVNSIIQDDYYKKIIYSELLLNNNWGKDYIMIENDNNLLKYTDFDTNGFKIFDIKNYNDLLQRFLKNEIKFITNKDINLENYHNEITDHEHTKILNSMPYKKDMYSDVLELSEYLEKYISELTKERVKIFNNDLWFRICRPNNVSDDDFNPCHKDVYLDFYRNVINIYLPVVGSNENSSLKIQEGSHKWNENETMVTNGGAYFKSTNKKYSVDAIVASKKPINMTRPNPSINQMMIFSPYLIHGCANNANHNTTRISLEVRFIKDDINGKKQEDDFNEFLKNRNWR